MASFELKGVWMESRAFSGGKQWLIRLERLRVVQEGYTGFTEKQVKGVNMRDFMFKWLTTDFGTKIHNGKW